MPVSTLAMRHFETHARERGFFRIAGIDEAGRGPLAGPVVAAACVLPFHVEIEGLDDSKKLTPRQREYLFQVITALPKIDYGIGVIEATVIDEINILQATFQAMLTAVACLLQPPDYLLIDGNRTPKTPIAKEAIVKGDSRSKSIAAASILAKVTRDRLMKEKWHPAFPQYGFDTHMGYGTKKHLLAIEKYGPCSIHRKSFEPIKSLDQRTL
jgi:ribonuclease HII